MRPAAVHVDSLVVVGARGLLREELLAALVEQELRAQLEGRARTTGRGAEHEAARAVADAVHEAIESSGGGR